jgi:hypothetical protein
LNNNHLHFSYPHSQGKSLTFRAHTHTHNNATHLEDSRPSSPRHRDPLGGRSNCADRSALQRSPKRDNKGSGWKKPQCKAMWLRKERPKLSWRSTPSHRNQWKKEARVVGCQRNEACNELPLRRKQQKRSSSGAAQERPNERRERKRRPGNRTNRFYRFRCHHFCFFFFFNVRPELNWTGRLGEKKSLLLRVPDWRPLKTWEKISSVLSVH